MSPPRPASAAQTVRRARRRAARVLGLALPLVFLDLWATAGQRGGGHGTSLLSAAAVCGFFWGVWVGCATAVAGFHGDPPA